MSPLSLTSTVTLSDGHHMPRLGLGVYVTLPGPETYNAVLWALEAGYRHIDGAEWYENEEDCGKAINDFIRSSGTPRHEIYFTTKLMRNSTTKWVGKAIQESLRKSGLEYIDLYLVHGPEANDGIDPVQCRVDTWRGCCEAKDTGLVRSIGVSNFGVAHLEQLIASKPKYLPTVNQVDLHPFMTRNALVSFCEAHKIVLEAWAPLVRGERFDHPVIVQLAIKYSKSPAQILVRYGLERGFVVIPKSTKQSRIVSNADVYDFALSAEDVDLLTSLDEFLVTDWEVTTIP